MFQRAAAKLNLSPFERAVLKFIEGAAASALIAGGQAFFQALATGGVDWRAALHTALIAMGATSLLALKKYGFAAGDPPLPESNL